MIVLKKKIFNQNELKISKNFGQIKAALDILGDFLSQKVAQISWISLNEVTLPAFLPWRLLWGAPAGFLLLLRIKFIPTFQTRTFYVYNDVLA